MPHDSPSSDPGADTPQSDPNSKPPRGLWALINRDQVPASEEAIDSQEESSEETPPLEAAPSRPRSLWALMQSSSVEEHPSQETGLVSEEVISLDISSETETSAKTAPEAREASSPSPEHPNAPALSEAVPSREQVLGKGSVPPPLPETEPSPAQLKSLVLEAKRSKWAWISLGLGTVSLPAAALAIEPAPWMKVPAMVLGFAALVVGLMVWTHRRRTAAGSARVRAAGGMLLGTAGMLLGPTVFAEYGNTLRREQGRRLTRVHLEEVGSGLLDFQRETGFFPMGGRFVDDTPMHGWMTALLPYIGEQELSLEIDREVPYDDLQNRPAMKTLVPSYLAAGSSSELVFGDLAPAHFAGLGGELLDPARGLAHVGIFGRNQDVNAEQILDGLSQTLVAGELAQGFPPWGSPTNWRQIEKGLNKDVHGFGNADRTGAMFLHADGSVRFYRNSIDPEILRKLSTRDGEDLIEPLP